eukprot:TRINITY_DN24240_c0_g1_i1.p1 TRINITY_DN24240_c0_g1~~TRINITY_DN24240_c0_g1_i1.p1  ORF type:complete len:808 (-),score=135.77 TRINITY_DN24240_c0_g1_i1:174-2552(-)
MAAAEVDAIHRLRADFHIWRQRSSAVEVSAVDVEEAAESAIELLFGGHRLQLFAEALRDDGRAQFFVESLEDDDGEGNDAMCVGVADLNDWLADVNIFLAEKVVSLASALDFMADTFVKLKNRVGKADAKIHCDNESRDNDSRTDRSSDDGICCDAEELFASGDVDFTLWCRSRRLPKQGMDELRTRFLAGRQSDAKLGVAALVVEEAARAAASFRGASDSALSFHAGLGFVHLAAHPVFGLGVNRDVAMQLGLDADAPLIIAIVLSEHVLAGEGWQLPNTRVKGIEHGEALADRMSIIEANFARVRFSQAREGASGDNYCCGVASDLLSRLLGDCLAAHLGEAPVAPWLQDVQTTWTSTGNFFIDFWRGAVPHFMQSAAAYCPVCLATHGAELQAAKVCPCSRELCIFRYEEFLMPVRAEIARDPALAELHISLAMSASDGDGASFEPFPSRFLRKNEVRLRGGVFEDSRGIPTGATGTRQWHVDSDNLESEESNKDMAALRAVLRKIPKLSRLPAEADTEERLRELLAPSGSAPKGGGYTDAGRASDGVETTKATGSTAYQLVQFVLGTNRLLLQRVTGEHALPKLGAASQIAVLRAGSPAAERNFLERKRLFGSNFGFHGSHVENWYSIMRNGLRVLSNTKFMKTGARFGEGIYLARQFLTAAGYCRGSCGSRYSSTFGEALQIVGVVEYINDPACVKQHMEKIVTVMDSTAVMLRYLLVYGATGLHDNIENGRVDIEELGIASRHDWLQQQVSLQAALEKQGHGRAPTDLSFVHFGSGDGGGAARSQH